MSDFNSFKEKLGHFSKKKQSKKVFHEESKNLIKYWEINLKFQKYKLPQIIL